MGDAASFQFTLIECLTGLAILGVVYVAYLILVAPDYRGKNNAYSLGRHDELGNWIPENTHVTVARALELAESRRTGRQLTKDTYTFEAHLTRGIKNTDFADAVLWLLEHGKKYDIIGSVEIDPDFFD